MSTLWQEIFKKTQELKGSGLNRPDAIEQLRLLYDHSGHITAAVATVYFYVPKEAQV